MLITFKPLTKNQLKNLPDYLTFAFLLQKDKALIEKSQ